MTIAAHVAAFADTSISKMDHFAKHMYGAKNLWQLGDGHRHRRRRIRVYEDIGNPPLNNLASLEPHTV